MGFGVAWSKKLAKNIFIKVGLLFIYLMITLFLAPLIQKALS